MYSIVLFESLCRFQEAKLLEEKTISDVALAKSDSFISVKTFEIDYNVMSEEQLRESIRQNPGSDDFPKLIEILLSSNRAEEALIVALRGLTHAPQHQLGRFLLAKAYFELGFYPFAIRELRSLVGIVPRNNEILALLKFLDPTYDASGVLAEPRPKEVVGEAVKAEAEFDVDDL